MAVDFQLEHGYIGVIGFLFVMLIAALATLDVLGITKVFLKSKSSPEMLLVIVICVLSIPFFIGIGKAISPFWADILFLVPFIFMVASIWCQKKND